jgi:hypothetical protein
LCLLTVDVLYAPGAWLAFGLGGWRPEQPAVQHQHLALHQRSQRQVRKQPQHVLVDVLQMHKTHLFIDTA